MNKGILKYFLVLLFVLVMTFVAWYFNNRSLIGIDDANIYFVYMRNLANGYGFVYNTGSERVEGFTSLLWTLIGGAFFVVSSKPELVLFIFNIAIVSYTLWRMGSFLDKYFNDERVISPQSLFFAGLLAVIPGYFEWTVLSLMETGLWSALLLLLTLNILEFENVADKGVKNIQFNVLLVLIVICRPESMLWGALFIVLRAYQYLSSEGDLKKVFSRLLVPLVMFASTILILTFWRLNYFGYPFPNTYYAKVSSDIIQNALDGLWYNYKYLNENPAVVLSVLFGTLAVWDCLRSGKKKELFITLVCLTVTLLALLIPVYTGGDHFAYGRFIQPAMPVIWLCFLSSLKHLQITIARLSYAFILLVFTSLITYSGWPKYFLYGNKPMAHEWYLAIKGRIHSEKLNVFFDKLSRYPSQGVLSAGGIAYSYKGVTNDLLGLNNVEMAHADVVKDRTLPKNHASFNKEVFYRQKPDLFFIADNFIPADSVKNFQGVAVNSFAGWIFKNIYHDEKFKQEYSSVAILKKGYPDAFATYASDSFLNTLDTNFYSYIVYK